MSCNAFFRPVCTGLEDGATALLGGAPTFQYGATAYTAEATARPADRGGSGLVQDNELIQQQVQYFLSLIKGSITICGVLK